MRLPCSETTDFTESVPIPRNHILAASDRNVSNRTAESWRKDFKLTAAINAGMDETAFATHTGYFRIGKHEQSGQWVRNDQSVLVSSPKEASLPARANTSGNHLNATGAKPPIERAFHVEGGPETGLSIAGKSVRLKLSGSYETGFWENDGNVKQWELPNVIGISPLP